MADFIGNVGISQAETWVDVTGGFATKSVAIQNQSAFSMRLHFGPSAPADDSEGVALPPFNWPLMFGEIGTKLWVRAERPGKVLHISEAG